MTRKPKTIHELLGYGKPASYKIKGKITQKQLVFMDECSRMSFVLVRPKKLDNTKKKNRS